MQPTRVSRGSLFHLRAEEEKHRRAQEAPWEKAPTAWRLRPAAAFAGLRNIHYAVGLVDRTGR